MTNAIEKTRGWCAIVMVMGISLACSGNRRNEVTPNSNPLLRSNGIGENSQSSNGMWGNGMWGNGMWGNGMWGNGMWGNGMWGNGMWGNGMWGNGLWGNGMWGNGGMWDNDTWAAGLTGDAAAPGDTLRSNPYLRQLLQYIYSCAMPATTRDTFLDPNNGSLTCTSSACEFGYECAADNRCVVPLRGAIGLGINADGTTWAESGQCDETCQRWVSACLLARTNAYGIKVQISMRAPRNAPDAIKFALRLADGEATACPMGSENDPACGYTLREGGFYGNLFQTAPGTLGPNREFVPMLPPQSDGTTAEVVRSAPIFTACAGEGSNIPQVTNRFCSSQGDQVVIDVPGTCSPTATRPGVCAGEDPVGGAFETCATKTGTVFDEVITVYLKEPLATCGNAVCEQGEEVGCPSDCHPGTWAKSFPGEYGFNRFDGGIVDVISEEANFAAAGMSTVAHDNTTNEDSIVVVGQSREDLDLGGGNLDVDLGWGIIAKYSTDGTLLWSYRFAPQGPARNDLRGWDISGGVRVDASGTITVLGQMITDFARPNESGLNPPQPVTAIWVNTFALGNGDLVPERSYILPIGNDRTPPPEPAGNPTFPSDVTTTRAWAVDAAGDLLLVAGYCGRMGFYMLNAGFEYVSSFCDPRNGPAPGFENGLLLAKLRPAAGQPPLGEARLGVAVWKRQLSDGMPQLGAHGLSLSANTTDILLLTAGTTGRLSKFSSADGATLWSHRAPDHAAYTAAGLGPTGQVYVGGVLEPGGAAFPGCEPGFFNVAGIRPFLAHFGPDYSCSVVNVAAVVCPPTPPGGWANGINPCQGSFADPNSYRVEPATISFDPDGNVIMGSFGNPAPGGGINFGSHGVRPSATFPTYTSNNIFLSAYGPYASPVLWVKQIPTILSSFLLGMEVDRTGSRVVVTGNYSGSMLMDDRLLVTDTPKDPEVVDAFLGTFNAPSPSDNTAASIGVARDRAGATINTVPKPVFTQATSSAGAVVFFMPPTAIDDGNAGTSVTCTPKPNTTFPIGTTTVTCTASDPRGNRSTASFPVTVVDLTAPVFSPVADITVQANSASGAIVTYAAPTAIDQVDGARPVTCTPASGSLFSVGRTTVTCTAADLSNHQSQTMFTVVVTPAADTAPPTITVPASMTVEAMTPAGATVAFAASATDDVGVVSFTCMPASGSVFAIGITTVTCSARDAAGNQASKSFTVTVVDTTKPMWTKVPGTIIAYATSTAGAKVSYTKPCATDVVDGERPVTCTPASGAQFPVNKTTVTCTASDTKGNATSVQFTVWVQYQAPSDGSFFLFPIRPDGSSVFRVGRPVPARFKLTGASKDITNLRATFQATKISTLVQGTTEVTSDETVDDTDFVFKYRPLLKFYAYRWKTRDQTQGTYRLTATLGDGVVHQINVSLKR